MHKANLGGVMVLNILIQILIFKIWMMLMDKQINVVMLRIIAVCGILEIVMQIMTSSVKFQKARNNFYNQFI